MSNSSPLYRPLTICLGSVVLLQPIQSQAATQTLVEPGTASQLVLRPANLPDLHQPPKNLSTIEAFLPEFSTQPPAVELYRSRQDSPVIKPFRPEFLTQTIHLVISLKKRRVYIYEGSKLRISYPVAIGRTGWETPTGKFQVIEMQKNPGWTHPLTQEVVPPGRDNPLGERWIAFWTDGNNYIGLHGTPSRESIGKAASHGCVRMYNEHIRELYAMVKPGTPVFVEP
jgi:lipoprotein-anchoring transpeptidase ErfK/SrfK